MRLMKKAVGAAVALALSVSMLVGCGSTASSTASSAASSATESVASSAVSEAASEVDENEAAATQLLKDLTGSYQELWPVILADDYTQTWLDDCTALVGPSDSGKSTLAKLAAGFWDVKNGTITMGGHNLKSIPLTQLYEQVAFVSQDNYLFDDTVRENIRMGRLNATDAEIEAAAHAAGCDSFIGELEHGFDTRVGGGGAHLPGGERQRISIARAMLKNAPIIMIAHRLKTVRHADQILVVDHGHIVQQGKHEDLINQPGIYADFVGGRKQAAGWKL